MTFDGVARLAAKAAGKGKKIERTHGVSLDPETSGVNFIYSKVEVVVVVVAVANALIRSPFILPCYYIYICT